MSTINDYYLNAILSQAAYADLSKDLNTNLLQYILELQKEGFSETEATDFANTYEILDSQPNTFQGFSATVFRKR